MRRDTELLASPQASASTPTKADTPRRSPPSNLHRLITRQASLSTSSSSPITVRPEARRAYEVAQMDNSTAHQQRAEWRHADGKSSPVVDPTTDSTCLLQQAANYASLALCQPATQSKTRSSLPSALSTPGGAKLPPPVSSASSAVRRLLVRTKSGRRSQGSSASREDDDAAASCVAEGISIPTTQRSGEDEVWETAPRLSMSSIASSGTSEVKTPESVNTNIEWQSYRTGGAVAGSSGSESVSHEVVYGSQPIPHSPGLIDMGDAMRDPDGLTAMGFDAAQAAVNFALTDAAELGINRTGTIKHKRPDTLLRLPSISYRTDTTITPSRAGSPALAESSNTEEGDNWSANRTHNVWDVTSIVDSLSPTDKDPSSALSRGEQSNPSLPCPPSIPFKFDRMKQRTDSNDSVEPPASVVSSDSWRSLLPEDDPYYIPDLSSASSSSSSVWL